jgi:ABC-2 type transport system permease protein
MRTVFAVAGLSLRKMKNEKVFLLIMMGLAALFSVIGVVFGGGSGAAPVIPVGISDLDQSGLSAGMVAALETEGIYAVRHLSEQDLYDSVREGRIDVGFVIPEGFEESLSSDVPLRVGVVSLATSNSSMAIGKVLERKVTEHLLGEAVEAVAMEQASALSVQTEVNVESLRERVSREYSESPALVVSYSNVTKTEEPASSGQGLNQSFVIGIYLMFTMFTALFSAGEILQEKRDGTWVRLMASPASRAGILGGKVLGVYAIGALQLTVLLLAGRYLNKVDYGPNIFGVAAVLAVFMLAVTGLGVMLSTFVKTLAQLQTLAPIVIVSTCMLGGCYWPLEVVSPLMQKIAKFTPQAWAMTAVTDMVARGLTLPEVFTNIFVLLGFAAVFLGVGVARVKFE